MVPEPQFAKAFSVFDARVLFVLVPVAVAVALAECRNARFS